MRNALKDANRIVIKVGTSTLTYDTGKMNFNTFEKLARVISDISNQGKEVILVTSGAIGVGTGMLKMKTPPKTIREKQAVAAVGQNELMQIYSKFFSEYHYIVAQILLTRDIVGNSTGRKNVINTFETLLKKGIIPIVNENDSVSTAEIKAGEYETFSENDTLSALVSKLVKADLLIILSDIDGLYDCDPRIYNNSKLVSTVKEITPEIENYAGDKGSSRSTGGMRTKLSAAKLATSGGVNVVLASGKDPMIILDILNGAETGTLFIRKGK